MMPLHKSLSRITEKGQLFIPPHLLRQAGGKPGQMVEFTIGPRGVIQVQLKKPHIPGRPKPRLNPKRIH